MGSQVTEEANRPRKSTWREFLTWMKEPIAATLGIASLAATFGGGVIVGAKWFVSSEVEPLRKELARATDANSMKLQELRTQIQTNEEDAGEIAKTLTDNIKANGDRMSRNTERIAGAEATLMATERRIDRIHAQVTKNADAVTELKVRGTPE